MMYPQSSFANLRRSWILALLVLSFLPLGPGIARAAWVPDGVPIALPRSAQTHPRLIADGTGGTIMVWMDFRSCSGTGADIYAQRFDVTGSPLWGSDGVPICTAVSAQSFPQVVTDIAGGALIFWHDFRSGNTDIYGQRISHTGIPLWAPNGIPICTEPSDQTFDPYTQGACSDGAGGAFVTWTDFRVASEVHVYVQHVKESGISVFVADGILISAALRDQLHPEICADGSSGAFIAYTDRSTEVDVYVQHVDGVGSVAWADGFPLCTAAGIQRFPVITPDGSGGAIVSWPDERGIDVDVYAQRITIVDGDVWSPSNGVNVTAFMGNQDGPEITSDASGGAIISWHDESFSVFGDVYAQRISGSGTLLWATDPGVPICIEPDTQVPRRIEPDGSGGAIVVWEDLRGDDIDIYAQRIGSDGAHLWSPATGVAVCVATLLQKDVDLAPDGTGGAFLVWADGRGGIGPSSIGSDIYAARVSSEGALPWQPDGAVVAAPEAIQHSPALVADGAGGGVFAWVDRRADCAGDIRVQRMNAEGEQLATADGRVVCAASGAQHSPALCSDGSEGAIVVWVDERAGNADIYCRRVDPEGDPLWGGDGVPICVDPASQTAPAITPCESGGAVMVWVDQRGNAIRIFAQRIMASGLIAPGWPVNGLLVSSAPNAHEQVTPQVISDGDCGAIVVWAERRADHFDIYAQRVDQFAVRRWVFGDVPLCVAPEDQISPRIVSDGANGVIATWEDHRAGTPDILARRVDSGGTALWFADGTVVYAGAFEQTQPVIAPDNAGGAIIAWTDSRGASLDVYAQRMSAAGARLWPPDGVLVCGESGQQQSPAITADGAGGAVIAWRDNRTADDDIYAQRLNRFGMAHCPPCGLPLCSAPTPQFGHVLASDDAGGAIGGWIDLRSMRSGGQTIYAMRIAPECGMYATGVEPSAGAAPQPRIRSVPNPFHFGTTISYRVEREGHVTISIFDVSGRRIRTLVDRIQGAGDYQIPWRGELDGGGVAASGTYLCSAVLSGVRLPAKRIVLLR